MFTNGERETEGKAFKVVESRAILQFSLKVNLKLLQPLRDWWMLNQVM